MTHLKNPGTIVAGLLVFLIASPPGLLHAQQPTASSSNPAAAQSAPSDAAVPGQEPLTFAERFKIYEHSFVNPESFVGPALGASFSQLRKTPEEWGSGMGGYGRRLASAYGRSVIGRTIRFGVASLDGEDTRFAASNENGIWRRTRHAAVGTFISRTSRAGTMPAFSRFFDAYGSAFISNTWQPVSSNDTRHALTRGSTTILSGVGWRVFQEFWPDIRNALHHKRP